MERIETNEALDGSLVMLLDDRELGGSATLVYVPMVEDPYEPGHMEGTNRASTAYPVSNIVDLHPQKVAKASVADKVVISIQMETASNSIALFNTNSSTVEIEVLDSGGTAFFTELNELQAATSYEQLITDRGRGDTKDLYVEYPFYSGSHIVNIYLTSPVGADVLDMGVVFIGTHLSTPSATYGATQTFKDYSIVSELASGATYILQRSIVRKFDLTFDMAISAGAAERLKDTFLKIGPNPIPWVLMDCNQGSWLVFARKSTEPSGSYYAYDRIKSRISLIEVL